MKRLIAYIIILFITLTVSAQSDTVSVDVIHSDSLITEEVHVDSVVVPPYEVAFKRLKRNHWLNRFYHFAADIVLSPPRDTLYVDTQDRYNWCAEVQLTSRFENIEMDADDDFNVSLAPSVRTRLGPFFGWRFLFLGYNIDLKSVFFNDDETDLSASVYSTRFGLDLFYRRVGGNYKINKVKIAGEDYTDLLKGKYFDGIHLGMTRVSFYYVLNYKRFSHQAAYSQSNRQLRSAGSTILGMSYAHNRIVMDWEKFTSLVNHDYSDYSSNTLYGMMKNDEISFTGGYAYNWVFAKNWLAAGELTGALGYLIQHSSTQTKEDDKSIFETFARFSEKNIAFNSTIRFSVLWNNGPWFIGTQGNIFYYQYGNGMMMTRNILGTLYCYVGFNF